MKNIFIAFLNVRSLCSSIADVKHIISMKDYDKMGLVETLLSENIPDKNILIDVYKIFSADRGT